MDVIENPEVEVDGCSVSFIPRRTPPLEKEPLIMMECDEKTLNMFNELLCTDQLSKREHYRLFRTCVKKASSGLLPLTESHIATLSLIDFFFYDKWKVPKLSLQTGTWLFSVMSITSELTFLSWLFYLAPRQHVSLTFLIYLLTSFLFMWSSHVLFHLITGKIVGIKFHGYFIFKPSFHKILALKSTPIPIRVPGIKYDLASFLQSSRKKRMLMYILAPILANAIFIVNYMLIILQFNELDVWMLLGGMMILISYVLMMILSYRFHGDLWKARHLT